MATLTPAYGRDYKSAAAAKADFRAGKDFIYLDMFSPYNGKPCNINDLPKGSEVRIRYKKKTMVTTAKV
jgi:hypothetical protein